MRPRVESAPPSEYSLGPEGIDLARLAGLELDPWQQDALTLMLSVRPDGKWACFEYAEIVSRQNGKGSLLEARALAGLFLLGERLIMWSAHEYKTAMEGFRRFRDLLRALGEPISETLIDVGGVQVKISNTNGEESFERLDTGQRVKFIARSKGSGRGFSGDVNIIDEAFAYTEDQHAALMPTMSARPNPQIIYTTSPPLTGDTGQILYRLRERGERGGDDSLGFRDWGMAGDLEHLGGLKLDDPDVWARTNPAFRIRITEETVAREWRSLSAVDFARERLGVWPKQITGAGGAIDLGAWTLLADAKSKRSGPVSLAVDIAPHRNYAAIGLFGTRKDGVGHLQIVDYRPGTDWVIERLLELKAALVPVAIAMGRGTYASMDADLEKAGLRQSVDPEKPRRGDLAVTNATEMSAACGQFIDAVRQGTFRHTAQQPLDASVAGAKTREGTDNIAWTRKGVDVDICPIVVATLARWVHEERAHRVTAADYDVKESIW